MIGVKYFWAVILGLVISLSGVFVGNMIVAQTKKLEAEVGRLTVELFDAKVALSKIDDQHWQERMENFLQRHGVKEGDKVISSTKKATADRDMQKIMLGVTVKEALGDHCAIGAVGEVGAWQVDPAHWGPVPKDLEGQAIKAEDILRYYIKERGSVEEGLMWYCGGSRAYAREVIWLIGDI